MPASSQRQQLTGRNTLRPYCPSHILVGHNSLRPREVHTYRNGVVYDYAACLPGKVFLASVALRWPGGHQTFAGTICLLRHFLPLFSVVFWPNTAFYPVAGLAKFLLIQGISGKICTRTARLTKLARCGHIDRFTLTRQNLNTRALAQQVYGRFHENHHTAD